jgi:hypothetical protein
VSGAWVTWPARIRTWRSVTDITPNLDHAVAQLRSHRHLTDAAHHYTPGATTVTFHLLVHWGITEPIVAGSARIALRQCIPTARLGLSHRHTGPHIDGTLRFPYWPTAFHWWW